MSHFVRVDERVLEKVDELVAAADRVVASMGHDGTVWEEEMRDTDPQMLTYLKNLRRALDNYRSPL